MPTRTHHRVPPILITDGRNTTTHTFTETSSATPDVKLISRVGYDGELVRRSYVITPALPEMILGSPLTFMEKLGELLKFSNYDNEDDLWLEEIHVRQSNGRVTGYKVPMTDFEKYLQELKNPELLHLDVTPRSEQGAIEI